MNLSEADLERVMTEKAVQKAIDSMGPGFHKLTPEAQDSLRKMYEHLLKEFLIQIQDIQKHSHRLAVDGVLKILEMGKVSLTPVMFEAIQAFKEIH